MRRPSPLEVPSFIGQRSGHTVAASMPSGPSATSWSSRAETVLSQSRTVLQSKSAVALRDAVAAFDEAASHFDEAHPTNTARDAAVNASTALLKRAEACGVARRAPCKTAADSPTTHHDSPQQQRWELVVDAVVTVAPPDAAVAAVEQRLANADSASASSDFDLHAATAALEDTFGDVPPTNSAPSAEAVPQQTEASAGSGHTRSALCHLRDAVTHAAMIVEHHGHAAGDAGKAWRRRVLEETSAASVGLLDRQAAVAVALADLDRSTQLERRGLTDAAVLTAGVAKRPSVAEATAAYDTAVTALHRAEAGAVTASASLRSVLQHYPQDEAALRLLGTAGDLELGRQWLHWADHGRSIAGGYAVLGGGERRTLGSPGSPPLLPAVPSASTTNDAKTRAQTLSDERIKMPQKAAHISAEFDDTAAFAARDSVVRLVKARRLSDDTTVVLRCYPLDAPRTMCDVQRVMKLLRRVHAIHGPRLRGPGTETVLLPTSGFVDALQNVVVLEFPYCPGGALDGARMSAAFSTMALDDVCRVCERLLAAVAGLHECGVHHGDLTPGNLLFWDATTPCIGDVCDTLTFARTTTIARATPGYLPPEVLEAFVFNAKPSEWTEASLAGNESMEAGNSVDMYRNAVVDSYQTGMLLSTILHKAGLDGSSSAVRQGDGGGSPQEAHVQGSDEDPHRPADQECGPAATPKRKTRFGAQRDRVVKAIAATAAEMTARDPQARLSSVADALRRVREAMSVSATVVDAQRSAVLPPRYWVNRVASLGAPTGTAPSSASKPTRDLDLAAAATSVEQVLGHGDHGAAKGRAFIAAAAGRSLHESSYGLAKLRPLFEAAMPGVRVTSVHRNEDHAQWTVYAAERQRLVHRCAARGVDIALPPTLASTTFGRTVGGPLHGDNGAATADGVKDGRNSRAATNEDYAFALSDALVTPLQRRCNEAFLLHGTTLPLGRLIASRGFDPSRSGERVGARFGQGTYFTPSLWKALGYALPVSTDVGSHAPSDGAAVEQGVVLVSRVALGQVVDVGLCAPHMATWRRPPMCAVSTSSFDGSSGASHDAGTAEDEYDAVLGDNGRRGAVCVVYRHTRAFPEYIVRVEFDPSA